MVSVASPQAVHVHPDDADSARLHAIRPDAYPDPVGKAELTVAVSPVDALFGFRAPGEIVKELARVPEFADAVGRAATDKFVKEVRTGRGGAESLEELFGAFVSADEAKRSACLYAAVRRLEQMPDGSLSSDDTLLLRLHVAFPADPMCFAVYFLNLVRLEPGSAVFVPPKVPHAYLSGDIIEVSTCSTNVARAGLTDEALDLKEFCNNLTYDVSLVKVCCFFLEWSLLYQFLTLFSLHCFIRVLEASRRMNTRPRLCLPLPSSCFTSTTFQVVATTILLSLCTFPLPHHRCRVLDAMGLKLTYIHVSFSK